MKISDAVSGVVLILFACAVFYMTRSFPPMPGQRFGPSLLPNVIAMVLGVCGVILIAQTIRRRQVLPLFVLPEWAHVPKFAVNFSVVLGAMLFYIAASDRLGFVITGFMTLFALLLTWRRGSLWSTGLISAIAVVVIQIFFGKLLRVPLPWGFLEAYSF
jgi:putative tricarboxylic transport membrane protein